MHSGTVSPSVHKVDIRNPHFELRLPLCVLQYNIRCNILLKTQLRYITIIIIIIIMNLSWNWATC